MPDPQSGSKKLQDGRIDVYALPVLSISDLLKKAGDRSGLTMFAPIEDIPIFWPTLLSGNKTGPCGMPTTWFWPK